ncbi:unnamed protein product [Caenorhabditis auriculariae]|uniref:Cyclin-like domain-containing protein n=1 Tax=Caenorhabditis auriculariae TaxID=2777116 RepID=A0A8S1GYG3_9PELO|nr:unnamed protein product [Caenorhabditis auriculariae]
MRYTVGTANGMSSDSTDAGTSFARPVSRPWLFSKDEMRRSASAFDGVSPEEELAYRQKATQFLHEMVDHLHHGNNSLTITMCVASINLHRFFYFHSFKQFDYKDIAAACIFLAGKSEDSPRKLSSVVRVWWEKKFPHQKNIPSESHMASACQMIVHLETVILHTISFDLTVELPHQHVLRMTQNVFRGQKEVMKTAYFLVTDLLCVTDWPIRFRSTTIAAASVHIVSSVFKIAKVGQTNWWASSDFLQEPVTLEILDEMAAEFLQIYKTIPSRSHCSSFKRLDPHGLHKRIVPENSASNVVLPPPPMAPCLQPKKLDISAYKERIKDKPAVGAVPEQPRTSFLPDFNTQVKDEGRAETPKLASKISDALSMPTSHFNGNGVPLEMSTSLRNTNGKPPRPEGERRHRDHESRRNRHSQSGGERVASSYERHAEKERRKEKRDYLLMAESTEKDYPSEKKARMGSVSINFVSSSTRDFSNGAVAKARRDSISSSSSSQHSSQETRITTSSQTVRNLDLSTPGSVPPRVFVPPPPPAPVFVAMELEEGEVE